MFDHNLCFFVQRSLNVLAVSDPPGELEVFFSALFSVPREDEGDSWTHAETAGISDSPDFREASGCLWERTRNGRNYSDFQR